MAQDYAKKFYDSSRWRKCRRAYIAERQSIDGGLCEKCRQAVGYLVHHIDWLTPDNIGDPDVSLNHERLALVCLDCHNSIDPAESGREMLAFDDTGQPIPIKRSG